MKAPESFRTPRLLLRKPRPGDAAAIFAAYAQDAEVTHYLTWIPHKSLSVTQTVLDRLIAGWESGTEFSWLLFSLADDELVGAVSARCDGHRIDLGYVLAHPYWNQGLMTEALLPVVEWALAVPSVFRVWAVCDTENFSSARVLEKAGFQREGILRQWAIHPNISAVPRDCYSYVRLRNTNPIISFARVTAADFDEFVALRIASMRESLEQVGRFDSERACERLRKSFYPEHTQVIEYDGHRVGFYTFRLADDGFHLDHLYIHPDWQLRGIGSYVMRRLLTESEVRQLPVRLGALRGSESNAFYQRHGFTMSSEEEWDIYYIRTPALSFHLLSRDEFELIRPLWEQLNAHHANLPSTFAAEIGARTFESRLQAFRDKAASGQFRVEVAHVGSQEEPAGYCVTSLDSEGAGEIDSLFVAPVHRRTGIASALMRRALDWLRESGSRSQRVVVLYDNPEAAVFYQQFGFHPRNIEFERKSQADTHDA